MNVCCEVLIQQTCGRFYLRLNNARTSPRFKPLQFILNAQLHSYSSAVLESEDGRQARGSIPAQNSGIKGFWFNSQNRA